MDQNVESVKQNQKILIVSRGNLVVVDKLKQELKKYECDIFISPVVSHDLTQFLYVFIVNGDHLVFQKQPQSRLIYVFWNSKHKADDLHKRLVNHPSEKIKIINLLINDNFNDDDLEKIMWFTFSRTDERFLTIHRTSSAEQRIEVLPVVPEKPHIKHINLKSYFQPKKIPGLLLVFAIIYHFLFIPPLLIASYFVYHSASQLQARNSDVSSKHAVTADRSLTIAKKLYSLARPTYLIFSIAFLPDNIFQLNETSLVLLKKAPRLEQKSSRFISLFLKKDKTDDEVNEISRIKNEILTDISDLDSYLDLLYQRLPDFVPDAPALKDALVQTSSIIGVAKRMLPHFDSLLGKDTDKTYVILFANNMELRPGGGFIGSFGILKVNRYTINELRVYDVYDADGQLIEHVEPPSAIKDYLKQPHWFLRDSAFSADNLENYKNAVFFLEKEMGMNQFDGGILMTTTAIRNVLEAFGSLYIPDYKEYVNKDNFYLKAQLYAEKNFFPGSKQKKRFLSSVMNQLLIESENISSPKLIQMLKKSLDEKQIVMYMQDQSFQATIDSLYWSGRMVNPTCKSAIKNCIADYVFPFEANLGVNKANFFVTRRINIESRFGADGSIDNTFSVTIKNASSNELFPGGIYANYMQIALPSKANIKRIMKDKTQIETYDLKEGLHKIVGFYAEVKPRTESVITVEYTLDKKISHGKAAYQLIIQKQTGSSNSDMNVRVVLPANMYLIDKNFSPLVKDNTITYNTSLSADKVFFIELFKD